MSTPRLQAEAERLAQSLMLIDTHIDLPYRLSERMADVAERTVDGNFDWPRARAGGLDLAFMAIFVPVSHQPAPGAKRLADELLDMMDGIIRGRPDRFARVTSVAEANAAFAAGRLGLAFAIENAAALEGDLDNLQHFYDRGVRYVTLVHSKSNAICDSSYDKERQWNGLSPFGRELVWGMNRLGLMVDVSHVSDESFLSVLEQTRAPVIASHSSCRHFTPGWERNMSDEMILRLAANGGVIQINFGSSFISDRFRREREAERERVDAELAVQGIPTDSPQAREFCRRWFRERPIELARVSDVADHVDHVVRLAGIDHVGLGSDFEGVGDTLPIGLEDVSCYPNLFRELLERGYSAAQLAKIASGNLLRVWSEVERLSAAPSP